MKLIIDISEGDYKWIKDHVMTVNEQRIANGTPLDDLKKDIDKESVMHMDGEIYVRNIDVKRILSGNEVSE